LGRLVSCREKNTEKNGEKGIAKENIETEETCTKTQNRRRIEGNVGDKRPDASKMAGSGLARSTRKSSHQQETRNTYPLAQLGRRDGRLGN
jgi:hypothetical protein